MGTANNDENLLSPVRIQSLIDACHQQKLSRRSARTQLISHAKSSGFITNLCRKSAWTLLIDPPSDDDYSAGRFLCDDSRSSSRISVPSIDQQQIESHQYYEQVRMDVIRTLKRFPPSKHRVHHVTARLNLSSRRLFRRGEKSVARPIDCHDCQDSHSPWRIALLSSSLVQYSIDVFILLFLSRAITIFV